MRRYLVMLATILAALSVAAPAVANAPRVNPPRQYYLALGDSLAFGYQHARFEKLAREGAYNPAAFSTGYVDVFGRRLEGVRPGIRTVNLSCPNETTASFIDGGCEFHLHLALHADYPAEMPQLTAALAFLRENSGKVSPVTVGLGSNDALNVINGCNSDVACTRQQFPALLGRLRTNLGRILKELRATSPTSDVIVVQPHNPLPLLMPETAMLFRAINTAVAEVAEVHRARVAATQERFMPVAICSLTLLCPREAGLAPDLHPNDVGYAAIAAVIWEASGYDRFERRR